MELIPEIRLGWFNGWIPLGFLYLVFGTLMATFPKEVVKRLYDRSDRSPGLRILRVTGKLLALACFVLIIFTPLKVGDYVLILGGILFTIGLAGLIIALFNFKNTAFDQLVTGGIYRISRNPQIFSFTISLLGICISIGSWIAIFILIVIQFFSHSRILAEENSCLDQYGDSFKNYMKRVPRYFLFF